MLHRGLSTDEPAVLHAVFPLVGSDQELDALTAGALTMTSSAVRGAVPHTVGIAVVLLLIASLTYVHFGANRDDTAPVT